MQVDILTAIIGGVIAIITAMLTWLFSRKETSAKTDKLRAEITKLEAEAEQVRVNTTKTLTGISQSEGLSQYEDVKETIPKRIKRIREKNQNESSDILYSPPELSKRMIYLYSVRHDIEDKMRRIVLSSGGGWAGSSWATFRSYFGLATQHRLISEKLEREINDFYFYTQGPLNGHNISDPVFLEIQYLASSLTGQLESVLYKAKRAENHE